MFLGWLHKNTRVETGRCVFGRSKWSFMGKSRVHKRPCMGNFPCTNIESWGAQPRWTRLLWRSRGLQACVREHFLKCHILPDTHNLERLFFIYRLWRKQFPTEHLMRLLDYGPPLRLKVAPMICKEDFFSPQNIQENQDTTIKQLSLSLLRGCDTPKNATRNPRFDSGSC